MEEVKEPQMAICRNCRGKGKYKVSGGKKPIYCDECKGTGEALLQPEKPFKLLDTPNIPVERVGGIKIRG